MRKIRATGQQALVNQAVNQLLDTFDYPDEVGGGGGGVIPGGGGGMAHVLIVSESEPLSVQSKADYTVPETSSAASLQSIFDAIDSSSSAGPWSIWMAGIFDLDDDVTAPSGCWIRGLGYTKVGGCI